MLDKPKKVLEDPSSSSQADRRSLSQENSVSPRLLNPTSTDSRKKERSSLMDLTLRSLENTDHLADSHSSKTDFTIIAYNLI